MTLAKCQARSQIVGVPGCNKKEHQRRISMILRILLRTKKNSFSLDKLKKN
jgi:hypothetical protein